MRRIIKSMLSEHGFEVLEAANGEDALEKLRASGSVDLAMVDWNMPVMNGLEFVKAVRAEERHAGMRIMMVTTETGVDEMTLALEAGADEYVMKPFTKEAIAEKVRLIGL
jgi:two-component system chemotaxis response regulator CheY